MTANGWLQILFFSACVLLVAKPLGSYLVRVYDGSVRWLAPLERVIYRLSGIDPAEDQPLCDLLRISHRAGNDLDARSWAQLLLQINGVEAPEDLPNLDSYLTVHEVFPRGLRAAAAAASG